MSKLTIFGQLFCTGILDFEFLASRWFCFWLSASVWRP